MSRNRSRGVRTRQDAPGAREVAAAFAGVGRALVGVAGAAARTAACAATGHVPDDSVPSPAGLRFCSRCCSRYVDESS